MAHPGHSEIGVAIAIEPRRRRSKQERRAVVEATFAPGVSVARVARAHGVNANQVHAWRRLYERGLLDAAPTQTALLPVRITESSAARTHSAASSGTIHIASAKGRVDLAGAPDPATLGIVLEHLLG